MKISRVWRRGLGVGKLLAAGLVIQTLWTMLGGPWRLPEFLSRDAKQIQEAMYLGNAL